MPSGSARGTPPPWSTVATMSRTTATSTPTSAPWTMPTPSSALRTPRDCGCSSTWCPTTARHSTRGSARPCPVGRATPCATGSSSVTAPVHTVSCHPTTGRRSSAVRPGSASSSRTGDPASGTCTSSIPASRTGTGTTRRYVPSSTGSCGSGSIVGWTDSVSTWRTPSSRT